ncbi:MAG: glycoside hydrolase family 2 [Lachnospira sp.]|nr:glycoside hydrolase family 2 [Lachnospira sp.]
MTGAEMKGWESHPRPQFKREKWCVLDKGWKLNSRDINVPYPPQSKLSGYDKEVEERLVYICEFGVPDEFDKERILLHFGAVDQIADVYVNDKHVTHHEGGYLPFNVDVTDVLKTGTVNKLTVCVTDELSLDYPYGKQCKKRGGMWYTPVSGIWQSVWLENVPLEYIRSIRMTPDMDRVDISVEGDFNGFSVAVSLPDGDSVTKHFAGKQGRLELNGAISDSGKTVTPELWSVKNPKLYQMSVSAGEDAVETYFALRKVDVREIDGVKRVCLNGKPVFMHGVLDQGYFQEGIYLPEDEAEYEKDVLRMKELGFNMLRKHIKVEPEAFYYACDKLGMLVVQDMVNNGSYSYLKDTVLPTIGFKKRKDNKYVAGDAKRREVFESHMKETLEHLYNHPCIVVYTIFNEGWGQFDSDRMYEVAKSVDGSRLYDSTSGWFAQEKSDFDSEHIYFRTKKIKVKDRPVFLSECGGFTYQVKGHCFDENKSYGYGACKDGMELTKRIVDMYEKMVLPAVGAGLCGCVYTQLSDVEEEVNGLYTYDREVCKVDKGMMRELGERLYRQV